jgi:glycosyltransferase involved in cell wall biosynthesis
MFYLPRVWRRLHGYWVKRAVVRNLRRLEAEHPVDLIDAHFGYPEGAGCVRAGAELGKPVFITMRGLERPVLQVPGCAEQLLEALERCTGIVSVSESLKALAVDHGIDPAKIRVIPNAVDREVFHLGDRQQARRILGVDGHAQLVVCVGMLVHGKGQHLLVEAAARLLPGHPNLRLALLGGTAHEPRYPEMVHDRIRKLGLAGVVYDTGSQPPERVATWLQAADVFALSTYDEGCCNAILEALACGVPVVTTPAGDNAILVDPPHRGRIVPIGDADGLADGLEQALATRWDREAIARFGADYTWDAVAQHTAAFFRERHPASDRNASLACEIPVAGGN